jgi:hypothetical protein
VSTTNPRQLCADDGPAPKLSKVRVMVVARLLDRLIAEFQRRGVVSDIVRTTGSTGLCSFMVALPILGDLDAEP